MILYEKLALVRDPGRFPWPIHAPAITQVLSMYFFTMNPNLSGDSPENAK